jgi:hypothetical protein
MNEQQKNQQVAEQIMQAGGSNGKPYRLGDWVALLDGKVVAVAGDLDSAVRALRRLDPDPKRGMVFEVGPAVVDVIR